MPKPKTKAELLEASQLRFSTLLGFIDQLTEEDRDKTFPPGTLNRNIRDVLMHLHHWHLLLVGWYEAGNRNEKPDVPATGYTWKTTPALNRWIQQHYQAVQFDKALIRLQESHDQVLTIIKSHSDEELFEKKRYAWTGSTSLGAYVISATSSHYDWAHKLIKKALK